MLEVVYTVLENSNHLCARFFSLQISERNISGCFCFLFCGIDVLNPINSCTRERYTYHLLTAASASRFTAREYIRDNACSSFLITSRVAEKLFAERGKSDAIVPTKSGLLSRGRNSLWKARKR